MITKNLTSRTLIIHTVGNLDALTADHYRGELRSLITEGYRFLIFDLEETPYMNSSGLGLLVEFFNSVRRIQGSIRLINCSKQVRWLLEQTHIESLFLNNGADGPPPEATERPNQQFNHLHDLMSDEIRVLFLINEFILKALILDDPRQIGQLLLEGVLKALRAEHGAFLMLNEAQTHLTLARLQQKTSTRFVPTYLESPLDARRLETALLDQGEAICHRLSETTQSDVSTFKKLGFELMLAAPIVGENRRFGLLAIEAADHTTDIFQAAKPLIMTFANVGGLAMEKALLLQESRHKNNELSSAIQKADQYQQSLDEASKLVALGTVTTGLSHLLNNQMVPLLGYTQLLRQTLDLSEEVSRKVELIHESGSEINATLEKVLHLTNINHNIAQDVDLPQLIQTILDLLRTKIEQANIDLQIHTPAQMPLIKGNPELLKQTVLAILHRSITTFTQEDADDHRWIRIITSVSDNNLRIVFEDNGQDLTRADFEDIIDPMPPMQEIKNGHFFNYNIPRSLTRRHDGQLLLERRKEGGKRVIIDLPVNSGNPSAEIHERDLLSSPN